MYPIHVVERLQTLIPSKYITLDLSELVILPLAYLTTSPPFRVNSTFILNNPVLLKLVTPHYKSITMMGWLCIIFELRKTNNYSISINYPIKLLKTHLIYKAYGCKKLIELGRMGDVCKIEI